MLITTKVKIDENNTDVQEEDDERLARIMLDIANDIKDSIKIEADWPSKNNDKRLPILDMKVWMDTQGTILYSHYEKPMSNKAFLNSQSAHPAACKKGVHTQEVIRRILNCSKKLDWKKRGSTCDNRLHDADDASRL